jgi:predicted MFS family arabinose efflux permease
MAEPAPRGATVSGDGSSAGDRVGAAGSDDLVPASERRIVLLLAAVQFVNILDFMMPSPLGPQFAAELGIETSQLGIVISSYTLAAGVAGLLGAFLLDRFDRRDALAVTLTGLALGTGGAVLASDLPSLVLARVVAGFFGGPATSLALAIVADTVPTVRRGRAMGSVMMAFSLASVLGVPAGLALASWGSWHTPFVVTGLLGLLSAFGARALLPPLRDHVHDVPPAEARAAMRAAMRSLFGDPTVRLSYVMTLVSSFGAFVLIPNVAAYVQHNLGYPAHLMSLLYGAGGLASFLALRPFGRLVDRVGSFRVSLAGAVSYAVVAWVGFVVGPSVIGAIERTVPTAEGVAFAPSWLFIVGIFVAFMLTSNARNVAFNTLASRVPRPELRARFQSFQSMVSHLGLAAGGLFGPLVLASEPDGRLVGIDQVAWVSIGTLLVVQGVMRVVERMVDARDGVSRDRVAAEAARP